MTPAADSDAGTLAAQALSLDHVGAIARDLDAAAARWQRLGFTLSPQSRQRGAVPGRTGMHPWASANRCAVFRRGYVELIGIVDAAAYQPWDRFLARFEGLHLLALRCADAASTFARLAPAAPFLAPPVERERKLTYRGEERVMRFRNIFSRDDDCTECRYIVIEHRTPELLWQPELIEHENGAVALEAAVIVSADPAAAMRARALDSIPNVQTPEEFATCHGWQPPSPCLAAITISFADRQRAIRLFEGRGLDVQRAGDEAWLAPDATNGFIMRLAQHA